MTKKEEIQLRNLQSTPPAKRTRCQISLTHGKFEDTEAIKEIEFSENDEVTSSKEPSLKDSESEVELSS